MKAHGRAKMRAQRQNSDGEVKAIVAMKEVANEMRQPPQSGFQEPAG